MERLRLNQARDLDLLRLRSGVARVKRQQQINLRLEHERCNIRRELAGLSPSRDLQKVDFEDVRVRENDDGGVLRVIARRKGAVESG